MLTQQEQQKITDMCYISNAISNNSQAMIDNLILLNDYEGFQKDINSIGIKEVERLAEDDNHYQFLLDQSPYLEHNIAAAQENIDDAKNTLVQLYDSINPNSGLLADFVKKQPMADMYGQTHDYSIALGYCIGNNATKQHKIDVMSGPFQDFFATSYLAYRNLEPAFDSQQEFDIRSKSMATTLKNLNIARPANKKFKRIEPVDDLLRYNIHVNATKTSGENGALTAHDIARVRFVGILYALDCMLKYVKTFDESTLTRANKKGINELKRNMNFMLDNMTFNLQDEHNYLYACGNVGFDTNDSRGIAGHIASKQKFLGTEWRESFKSKIDEINTQRIKWHYAEHFYSLVDLGRRLPVEAQHAFYHLLKTYSTKQFNRLDDIPFYNLVFMGRSMGQNDPVLENDFVNAIEKSINQYLTNTPARIEKIVEDSRNTWEQALADYDLVKPSDALIDFAKSKQK